MAYATLKRIMKGTKNDCWQLKQMGRDDTYAIKEEAQGVELPTLNMLNDLEKDGWHLVCIHKFGEEDIYIFKKRE